MKLVTLPRQEGENITLNTEKIEVLVPKGDRTAIHLSSGKVISVNLELAELVQQLTQQGWRK